MITTNNAANTSKYTALFTESFKFLKEEALVQDHFPVTLEDREIRKSLLQDLVDEGREQFTSVQEYFSHIEDLLILGGKKFLMLPLDEPVFEIDANKREITVPAEFKKNGISVQGDEIAESLIFRINRFFDYADLDNMIPQVQWENANKDTGTSSIFVVDDEKDAEYLYLMWPLKEEITKYPGTVKFSLRFYNAIGNDLVYSFSTKIASATINPSHDFSYSELTTNVIDAESNFVNAIRNSKNVAAENAVKPYFILDLDESMAESENAEYVVQDGVLPHLEAYIDPTNPKQTLRVQAVSNDTGLISYSWLYTDTLAASIADGEQYYLVPSSDTDVIYLESADRIDPVANKVYYKFDGTDYVATEFIPGETLYEKYSVVEVTSPHLVKESQTADPTAIEHVVGKYFCIAKNSVGGNFEEAQSLVIEFPGPQVLEISDDLAQYAFLDSQGIKELQVEAVIDERGAKDNYTWYYSAANPQGGFLSISQLSAEEQEKLTDNGNSLIVNGLPGYYKVQVTSTRNYHTSEPVESVICKVSPELQAPNITYPTKNMALSSLTGAVTMEVQVAPFESAFESEEITYQWYIWVDGDLQAIEGANERTYTVPKNTNESYCCEVTNRIGDEIRITRSYTFSVDRFVDDTDEEETPTTPTTPDEPVVNPDGGDDNTNPSGDDDPDENTDPVVDDPDDDDDING